MRMRPFLAGLLCLLAWANASRANPMDLTISRLYDPDECTTAALGRPDNNRVCADQGAFRELASEFGLAIAPPILAPAETLGYAGFYLGFEGWLTTINSASDDRNNVWWRSTEDGNPDKVLFVASVHARKGLPFSFELGTSISYVSATELVLLGADVRWAILEGYRTGWKAYFPDIAVRGAVNRLTGDDEMDMTVIGLDVAFSHPFAISGMMTITPYAGYQWVRIIADTALVLNGKEEGGHTLVECNPAPGESYQDACVGGVAGPNLKYLEFDREHIDRHRGFVGVRLMYEHFALTLQGAFASTQQQFGASIGFDY